MFRKSLPFVFVLFLATPFAWSATLTPSDVSRFAVIPNTDSTFQWTTSEPVPGEKLAFTLYDVYGNATDLRGTATLADGIVSATVAVPQGYWEIAFDALDERFGIVSLPVAEKWDTFFAIDGALSWLVRGDELREGMIKLSKRSGIGMIRERLRFSSVAPEEGKFDFDTADHYDLLRETCKKHGVEVLELFHDTPKWMGRVKVYPENLIQFADAADRFTEKWEHTWGAIELWNEPDIFFGGDLPADQYVPIVKAYAYRAKKRGGKTPIVGGVLALPNQDWLANAKANGMLDLIDVFSFHTYDRAPNMESIVETYRRYVGDNKLYENMPLWLTECGRPWKKGPGRPPVEQDLESVTDIVMKGVESKCCGIDRYFPFVLPYYEENDNNFGMLDKQGTPLRSFCGYAQMIHALAHHEYVGDLKLETLKIDNADSAPPILRARVFRKPEGGPSVVVLYTGNMTPTRFQTTFAVQKAETVTGEPCEPTEIRSGLVYLYADTIVDEVIQKDTNAMGLLSFAKKPFIPRTRDQYLSPVVPVFRYEEKVLQPNSRGYRLDPDAKESRIAFQLFNLSKTVQKGYIGRLVPQAYFEIESGKSENTAIEDWALHADDSISYHYDYQSGDEERPFIGRGCLDIRFLGNPTLEGRKKAHPDAVKFPMEKERWSQGIPANGQLEITNVESGVKFSATFGEGDKWCYPRTALPENVKIKSDGGIFAKIRCTGEGTIPRFFLFEEPSGAGYLSDERAACPADGKWYIISIPFSAFTHNSATPPDPDGKLDFDRIREISYGFNATGGSATLEIGELWIYCTRSRAPRQ